MESHSHAPSCALPVKISEYDFAYVLGALGKSTELRSSSLQIADPFVNLSHTAKGAIPSRDAKFDYVVVIPDYPEFTPDIHNISPNP